MPQIDLSILNQRQTPAFYADVLANRPAAGFVGRIFISTNTFAFFRDNGTGWDLIGGPGTGTVTGSGAAGQVSFWNGASSITGTNDLFWDSVNGHLGIGTNVPGTALQIDHDQNQFIRLNQTTATNDTKIAFQNSGIALWRIGNSYNNGANDFGIYDVVGSIQPVTVKKTTGQVLIGTSTVGSGKLVVASATSDNHIQIVGAAAPSLRIDSAESGPTKRIGIGLATAVNNFIQNSQNLDMCIFNGSTSAAGNMLFGIYDTGLANIQEAARISAARNFLIGSIVDSGQKLQISGTSLITGAANFSSTSVFGKANASPFKLLNVIADTADGFNDPVNFESYGTAGANILLRFAKGTYAAPTAISVNNLMGSIGVRGYDGTAFSGGGRAGIYMYAAEDFTSTAQGTFLDISTTANGTISRIERIRVQNNGNILIGTTTDAGQKLQVSGTSLFSGDVTINASGNPTLNILGSGAYTGQLIINAGGGGSSVIQANGGSNQLIIAPNNVAKLTIKTNTINITSIPTSAAGLSSGDVYSNAGILTIVP